MKVELKIDGQKMKVKSFYKRENGIDIGYKEKRKLPKTWEEYCKITGCKFIEMTECYTLENINTINFSAQSLTIDNQSRSVIHDKYTSLRKLGLLRDYYNDGWKVKDNYDKICSVITKQKGILFHNDETITYDDHFLSFKNKKLAGKFEKHFKELIEQAEDLI